MIDSCCYCDEPLPRRAKGDKKASRAWSRHMANCTMRKAAIAENERQRLIDLDMDEENERLQKEDDLLCDLRELGRAGCNSEMSDAIVQVIERMIERSQA